MALTYQGYLKLDELLRLQEPRSDGPEHDELLFIVIHQVYELWFKEVLHELDFLRARLDADDMPAVLKTMKRILTILKVLVAQVDILETMTPVDFLSFRAHLERGSGFQSAQFREVEFVLGHKRAEPLANYAEGSEERRRLKQRLSEPSLWDAFLRHLARRGLPVPKALLERDVSEPCPPSPEVQRILLEVYRKDPGLMQLCERLVDLDEGTMEWRYRHVQMVRRTIGGKVGTGGSEGAAYLATTLMRPVFPDLWAIRTEL
ncbi:MAG: tryptophan 2,3-dioxygenase [Gemmatimonadales bacterium]